MPSDEASISELAAILCIVCMLVGWAMGWSSHLESLTRAAADAGTECASDKAAYRSGIDACSYGLARCSAKLEQLERWAGEAKAFKDYWRGVAPVGPVETGNAH